MEIFDFFHFGSKALQSVTSLLPARQTTPLRLKLHPPHILYEPPPLFFFVQLRRLKSPAVSHPRARQKAPLCRMLQRPTILNKPPPLFFISQYHSSFCIFCHCHIYIGRYVQLGHLLLPVSSSLLRHHLSDEPLHLVLLLDVLSFVQFPLS